ncbi:MAG: hypothetical protein ACYSW8_27210 [Planctomycetota bacterium]
MFKRTSFHVLILLVVMTTYLRGIAAGEISVSKIRQIDLAGDDIVQVEADPARGFNFPFYLFVPAAIEKGSKNYLFVETNNTGTATDDFEVHREKALRLVKRLYPNRIARKLRVPLLVPVFPRPKSNWRMYAHALDRDCLETGEGKLKRLDLQLLAMIDYALELLRVNEMAMHDRIFMHGFSASAKFCNRFAFLHPERVKAAAAGGVNGLPTLPIRERSGRQLPFPIGIADIETFTGRPYDEQAHRNVAQYIYMGYLDRNDTLPSRDAWRENEAEIIREALAEKMMPDRWELTQAIYRDTLPRAQCVTYNGVGHAIKDEMLEDVVKFFQANSGDSYAAIEPHSYPFVEYRQLGEAHVNHIYWKGDKRLPGYAGKSLRDDTFLIGISDWVDGRNYKQLDEFVENAGFHFILRAEGRPDIVITRHDNYRGNSSAGNGEYQAFYAKLSGDQLKALAANVPYTIEPVNKSEKFFWTVNEGVRLIKPVYFDDLVLAALNNTMQEGISFNCSVESAMGLLNQLALSFDYEGTTKKINFRANLDRPPKTAKIEFWTKGLSTMEILLIICHRAKLDYRIEGTTVYVENKK